MTGVSTRWLAAGVVGAALLAGIGGGLLGASLISDDDPEAASAAGTGGSVCDVAQVAERVFPSLVTVNVSRGEVSGIGSGSVWDADGHILTNDHVLAPAAGGTVTVDFARGPAGIRATVVGRDPSTDLAVIKVDPAATTLRPIAIGDSSALVVGQPVVAAGSPLGLNATITAGVVSALGRYVDVGQGDEPAALINAVQTDAAVNPGNSGGPLADCAGRQVGVNSAGAQTPDSGGGSIGLNFAIPIDFASSVAQQLITDGRAVHPAIGVLSTTVTAEMANATGLPRGALIEQVLPGLGAAQAGLRAGDVITEVGGTAVNGTDELLVAVRTHRPGDKVPVVYQRAGTTGQATVTLAQL
ncbi:MAG: trypsin-like peptidase domain-containing protein [Actinoplanes sp.]